MKINLFYSFLLYLVLLLSFTIFIFNRDKITLIFNNIEEFKDRIDINLVPFKTISTFLKALREGSLSINIILINLVGNLVCMMPMVFFLPLIFPKQNKNIIFFLTITLIVLGIEVVQLITLTGTFDVDDMLLNIGGALGAYMFFKVEKISRIIRRIFLREKR